MEENNPFFFFLSYALPTKRPSLSERQLANLFPVVVEIVMTL